MISEVADLLGVNPEPANAFQAEIDALLRVPASSTRRSEETDSNRIDDVEVNILELLSQLPVAEGINSGLLAPQIGLSEQRAVYYLKRLVDGELAGESISIGHPAEYFIAQKGRGVLIERGRL